MESSDFSDGGKSVSKRMLRRKGRGGTLFVALAVQGCLLAVTLFVIVLDTPEKEPPAFEGQISMQEPRESLEQKKSLKRFTQRMSKPRLMERLAVEGALASDLPPLPELPAEAMSLEGDELALMGEASAMLEQSGLMEAASGLTGASSAASFFGVQDSGRRIAIVVNTSASVVRKARNRGVSIEKIQNEVAGLIEGLGSDSLFGIVQFSQGARRFAPYMAPALGKNKEAARLWVEGELRGNPPIEDESLLGHEAGLVEALEMEPDLMFVVTDGVLNRRTREGGRYTYPEIPYDSLLSRVEAEMRRRGLRTRVHVIGFELREKDREGLERLTRRYGGTLREM